LTIAFAAVLLVASAQQSVITGDSSVPGDLRVQGIRIEPNAAATRLVVELSDRAVTSIFGLSGPYRLVIDLPEVSFDLTEKRIGDGAGLISKIRHGLFRPGTSRIILDLRSPAKVAKHFMLPPDSDKPWRLVVVLEETTHARFVGLARPNAIPNQHPRP